MNVADYKDRLWRSLSGAPSAKLCSSLADALFALPAKESKFLTYTSLQHLAGLPQVNSDLVAAVNFLTSSSLALLEPHGQLIDDSGQEFTLDPEDFQQVLDHNTVVHPITGEVLSDAQSKVMPFFELCLPQDFRQATAT